MESVSRDAEKPDEIKSQKEIFKHGGLMYRLLFLLFFSALILTAADKTVPFRSGKILSAQISTRKPEIASDKQKDTPGGVWAEIIVKLNPGRKLGSMDYYIEVDGKKYFCRAIARNDDKYDADVWEISDPLDSDKIRILFNPPRTSGDSIEYEIKFAFRDTIPYPKVTFKNMESEKFTPASGIPAEGVMGGPAPAPAAPAAPEGETPAPAEEKGAPEAGKKQSSIGRVSVNDVSAV